MSVLVDIIVIAQTAVFCSIFACISVAAWKGEL